MENITAFAAHEAKAMEHILSEAGKKQKPKKTSLQLLILGYLFFFTNYYRVNIIFSLRMEFWKDN